MLIACAGAGQGGERPGLFERLAVDAHDVWASQEIAAGRTVGRLDEEPMTHPNIRPFGELDGAKRQYHPKTVARAIKAWSSSAFGRGVDDQGPGRARTPSKETS